MKNMNEYQQSLLDLQLDQACLLLKSLIQAGKTLPDYDQVWRNFASTKATTKRGGKK